MSPNATADFVVREATRKDMHDVCRLIKALAEFTNFEDQVHTTPEQLIKDGFDTNPPDFGCFVAELSNGEIVGFVLYFSCYKTWIGKSIFLEDLYVDPRYHRRGIGKQLFLSVAKVAHDTSQRMDLHVLKWNSCVDFYKKLGVENLSGSEDWQLFRLDGNNLNDLVKQQDVI